MVLFYSSGTHKRPLVDEPGLEAVGSCALRKRQLTASTSLEYTE